MSIKTDDFALPPTPRVVSAAPVSNSEEAIERALRPKARRPQRCSRSWQV